MLRACGRHRPPAIRPQALAIGHVMARAPSAKKVRAVCSSSVSLLGGTGCGGCMLVMKSVIQQAKDLGVDILYPLDQLAQLLGGGVGIGLDRIGNVPLFLALADRLCRGRD